MKLRAVFPMDKLAQPYVQTGAYYLQVTGFTDVIIRNVKFILLLIENKVVFSGLKSTGEAVKEKSQLFAQLVALMQLEGNTIDAIILANQK